MNEKLHKILVAGQMLGAPILVIEKQKQRETLEQMISKKFLVLGVGISLAEMYAYKVIKEKQIDSWDTKKRIAFKFSNSFLNQLQDRRLNDYERCFDALHNSTYKIDEHYKVESLDGYMSALIIIQSINLDLEKYKPKTADKKFFELIEKCYNEMLDYYNQEHQDFSEEIVSQIKNAIEE